MSVSEIRQLCVRDTEILERANLEPTAMLVSDLFQIVSLNTVAGFAEGECLNDTVYVRRLGKPRGPKDLALSSKVVFCRRSNIDRTSILVRASRAHLRVSHLLLSRRCHHH